MCASRASSRCGRLLAAAFVDLSHASSPTFLLLYCLSHSLSHTHTHALPLLAVQEVIDVKNLVCIPRGVLEGSIDSNVRLRHPRRCELSFAAVDPSHRALPWPRTQVDDLSTPMVLYCAGGMRSLLSADSLQVKACRLREALQRRRQWRRRPCRVASANARPHSKPPLRACAGDGILKRHVHGGRHCPLAR